MNLHLLNSTIRSSQVLGSVKNRIEAFAASHEEFPAMLRKAQQYLVARGKVDWSDPPPGVPPLRRSDSLGEDARASVSLNGFQFQTSRSEIRPAKTRNFIHRITKH